MKFLIKSCVLFLTLFCLSFSAIAAEKAKDSKPNIEKKTDESFYTEDKLNITVTANQPEFTLRLKSNQTTGYSWYLREYDRDLLVPLKHQYVKPEKQNLMGAPGYELWTFKMRPGAFTVPQQTVLRMVYSRASQGSDNSSQLVFRISTLGK